MTKKISPSIRFEARRLAKQAIKGQIRVLGNKLSNYNSADIAVRARAIEHRFYTLAAITLDETEKIRMALDERFNDELYRAQLYEG